jgi:hypothetical protein
MDHTEIINGLKGNRNVFKELLQDLKEEQYLWKSSPEKWCLLEIVCHLFDEEREDFRARTKHLLETPSEKLPSIDPQGWVETRSYLQQSYADKLKDFLIEREQSVKWLQTLSNPKWKNTYEHPVLGKMTAEMFLANWLAHDYLHIRQITKLKYDYLKNLSNEDLNYAGNW